MKIDFANLQFQYQKYKDEIDLAIQTVLDKSNYIMGEEITQLENSLEKFTGVNHAITCSNGTDALLLAMMALEIQPGDEIITPPFTFIATAETIAFMGARPVFVDIEEDTFNIDPKKIEEKITKRTKAIMPVSLFGQPPKMKQVQEIADKHGLKVIVDGAQSFGATYERVSDSCLGDISTTSFFPAKPLGCFGDGGAVFTNDEDLALKIKQLRVHGQNQRYHHKHIGMGGRLDTLQAAILAVKLKYYPQDIARRQNVAEKYLQLLTGKNLILPSLNHKCTSVWAQFTIRTENREDVQLGLKNRGIPTAVHYPIPLHLQECFNYLKHRKNEFPISEQASRQVLSLPMNPYLLDTEIAYICDNL